ncbi:MAG TPA: acyl-CoA thioesterase [Candidatus Bathyarchaeia archaeon]|nr:acyl-CoA thioesterase [Candidatus Bathyarchaeia archaeon]
MKRKFRTLLPVQFRDIDVAGHVNHATYLQYMETARVEFLRSIGQIDGGFRPRVILASCRCEYNRPITDERRVTVSLWVSRIGSRSWDFDYTVSNPKGVEFASGRTTQVAFDYRNRSTTRISNGLKKQLEKLSGKPLKFKTSE